MWEYIIEMNPIQIWLWLVVWIRLEDTGDLNMVTGF